jgi:choline dehydrogenase
MAVFDESWTHADVVVVGGGTSGAAVAGLLAEGSSARVLVLEAGPDYGARDSGRWPGDLLDARAMPITHAWGYDSGPLYPERVIPFDRARVIGGCSSHNGCAALWGSRSDYDGWDAAGWSANELLPIFHEVSRRMRVRRGDEAELGPYHRAVLDAAEALGIPRVDDLNDLDSDVGAGPFAANIRDGIRWNAAFAYLDPVREQPDLAVAGDVIVDRIEVRTGAPARVHAIRDGRALVIEADRVVLSSGTYGTPAILLRSGIGPAAHLGELGVDTLVDLPGVGANLHDHLLMGVLWAPKQPIPAPEYNLAESSMFLRSHPDMFVPDLHFMFIHVPFHLPTYSVPEGSWTIGVGLVRPASRGSVRLRSTALDDKPLIDPGYLAEAADVEAMVRGTKLARDLASAAAFDPWRGEEALPGESVQSDAELEDFVRHAAGSYFHPVGTCRMGVRPDAVVDPSLRVRGVQGLRVADASVMPSIVSANTNTAAMVIGEKAADLLRGTAPSPLSPGRAVVGA